MNEAKNARGPAWRTTQERVDRLKKYAAERDVSVTFVIEKAIDLYLDLYDAGVVTAAEEAAKLTGPSPEAVAAGVAQVKAFFDDPRANAALTAVLDEDDDVEVTT